ncbi:MAG: 2,3,4,5-tetrahydropyridine-2,6-dicarboxylate N-succinyltransferase, partial [Terriglobales bacterium]
MQQLKEAVERLFGLGSEIKNERETALRVFGELREALTAGEVRAAEKVDGAWRTNVWVKQGILLGFRLGELVE